MLTVNVYIIVIYDVITVDYCNFCYKSTELVHLCTLDIGLKYYYYSVYAFHNVI